MLFDAARRNNRFELLVIDECHVGVHREGSDLASPTLTVR